VRILSGNAAAAVAGVITGLNTFNPAIWAIRIALRQFISAVAGGSSGWLLSATCPNVGSSDDGILA
jgi:hypothetical protein